MKKGIVFLTFLVIFCIISVTNVRADRNPWKAGVQESYFSSNEKFELKVSPLRDLIIDGPSAAIFIKEGQERWSKNLPSTPGFVDISNDGNFIVLANWGWFDEGGFKSLSFYDGDGNLLRDVPFASPGRWLWQARISEDGRYYVIGDGNGREGGVEITLYDVAKQSELWTKGIGLESLDNVLISSDGKYSLVSTFNMDCKKWFFVVDVCLAPKDVEFTYLESSGNILWRFKNENGYAWEQEFIKLSNDGVSFQIYDLKNKKWLSFINKDGKVSSL